MSHVYRSNAKDRLAFKIIATGGTIDKDYSTESASLFVNTSFFKVIEDTLRLNAVYELAQILQKDSLEMTEDDRALILTEVMESKTNHIIVTHGTDSMVESAQYVSLNLRNANSPATIVFTGSFTPGRFSCTESSFNLGAAFVAAASLPSGVYITLGGRIYESGSVTKDYESQRFIET